MTKIYGRCDEWIRTGEEYTEHDIPSPSGAGATVYRHTELCERPPTQTAPVDQAHRRIYR